MKKRFVILTEFGESLRIASAAIAANKIRSVLTTLGIFIGVSFVVLMGWFLDGLDSAWEETISSLGYQVLYVHKFDWTGRTPWREIRKRPDITLDEIERAMEMIRSAEAVYPSVSDWGETIRTRDRSVSGIMVFGTTSDNAWEVAPSLLKGRFFTPNEDLFTSYVAVLGYNVWKELFPNEDPIGKTIYYENKKFRVIGILKKRGTLISDFGDNQIYIPFRTFLRMQGRRFSYTLVVRAPSIEQLEEVRDETIAVMRKVRRLEPGEPNNFSINSVSAFEQQTQTIRIAIWGIGIGMTGLSFLVGIIGIMNIMFVSVIERTREIGIRKAVGAKSRSILLQFLIEAGMLSAVGAGLAFLFCSGIIALTKFVLFPEATDFLQPFIPIQLLLIALVVAIVAGIIAGAGPAIRAARMDPVEALRYE